MARMLTIRDAVSAALQEIGLTQSVTQQVVAARDQDVVQMGALLSAVADELMDDQPYDTDLSDGNWVLHKDGSQDARFTDDLDLIMFDGRLAVMGLKYRFKKEKGLEFGEDMRDFYNRVNKLAARKNSRVIDRDADEGRQI